MRTFRVFACILFAFAGAMAFGWWVDQDMARAVGLVAAGLLCFTLSTISIKPVV